MCWPCYQIDQWLTPRSYEVDAPFGSVGSKPPTGGGGSFGVSAASRDAASAPAADAPEVAPLRKRITDVEAKTEAVGAKVDEHEDRIQKIEGQFVDPAWRAGLSQDSASSVAGSSVIRSATVGSHRRG